MRILFISNLYPNPHSPNMAAFSRQQIAALRAHAVIDVIAPIPWTGRIGDGVPSVREEQGVTIFHPTYYFTPKIFRVWYGHFFLASVNSVAEKLFALNKYDCILSSWLFPDAWAAAVLAGRHGLPLYVNVLGTDVNRLVPGTAVTRRSLWVLEQAAAVIAVSARLKDALVALGAPPDKIEVVYNGVDSSVFAPRSKAEARAALALALDRSVILFVGNLKREKGVVELVRAFAALKPPDDGMAQELIVVGSGPFEQKMRALATEYGVADRVRFVGSKTLPEVARWMNAADLFCLPSYMEGQPNVIIEALACRLPVVATSVGGIPELDDGSGFMRLVPPRSVPELKVALQEMLLKDHSEYNISIPSWQEYAAKVMHILNRSGSEST